MDLTAGYTNARTSTLNRTMVMPKKGARRPGLPEATPHADSKSYGGAQQTVEQEQQLLGSDSSRLPKSARPSTATRRSAGGSHHSRRETTTLEGRQLAPTLMQEARGIFDEVERTESLNTDRDKWAEARWRICALADAKEKEWTSAVERYEKDRALKVQIHELKLSVANRTIERAERFFAVCAEYNIDVDRVLCRDTVAMAHLRRPAMEPNPLESMVAITTTRSGTIIDQGRSNSPEYEMEMERLTRERDSLAEEARSLEANYSNLFKLYEKVREQCGQLKNVEEQLRAEIAEQSRRYTDLYSLYSDLLNDAQDKLNSADAEVQRAHRDAEERTLGLRLALKKAQVQLSTVESALESKTKETEELHKICNELIAKTPAADTNLLLSSISARSEKSSHGKE